MKKILVVLGIIIAVLLLGIFVFMFIIQSRTTPGTSRPVTITLPPANTAVDLFEGVIDLKNIAIANPNGFAERVFVSIPEIYVSVDTATLAGGGVKLLREVRIDISNINAIRRKDKKYNFEGILHQRPSQKKTGPKPKIRIGRLRVIFGHITFRDYTVGGDKPLAIRFDVGLDKTYTGLADLDQLAGAVSKDFLDKITIGDIRNFKFRELPAIARSALAAIPDEVKDRVFGKGKDRNRVIAELGGRFLNKIRGKK